MKFIDKWLEKHALKKTLKKQQKGAKKLNKKILIKKFPIAEKQFYEDMLVLEKTLKYCRVKGLKTKAEWESAGVPMNHVVKKFMKSSVRYADFRQDHAGDVMKNEIVY